MHGQCMANYTLVKMHLFNLLKLFLFWNKCQTEAAAVSSFPQEGAARCWVHFLGISNQNHLIIYSINTIHLNVFKMPSLLN